MLAEEEIAVNTEARRFVRAEVDVLLTRTARIKHLALQMDPSPQAIH
jgi:hypothetical protein